jgi:hypothetical protein
MWGNTVWLASIIAAAVFLHLVFLNLPTVNGEWYFADVGRFLSTRDEIFLARYFSNQSNTLGMPTVAHLASAGLLPLDVARIQRLMSISGLIPLGWALIRFNGILGSRTDARLLLLIIFLNPLVWIFAGRALPDAFPAALAIFACSLFINVQGKPLQRAAGALALSAAITLKYHSLLFLPLTWMLDAQQSATMHRIVRIAVTTVVILAAPLVYVFIIHANFGFWFTPRNELLKLSFEPAPAIANLTCYAGYLALLALPYSMLAVLRYTRLNVRILALGAGAFAIGFFFLAPNGEMNLGPFEGVMDKRAVNGILAAGSLVFVLALAAGLKEHKSSGAAVNLAVIILIYIGTLAFVRPAQRYLLFVLPFFYLLIIPAADGLRAALLAIAIYVPINVVLLLNQIATGEAATDLTNKIEACGLLTASEPGNIIGTTGDRFPFNSETAKFKVTIGRPKNAILSAEASYALVFRKVYSLVPLEESLATPELPICKEE